MSTAIEHSAQDADDGFVVAPLSVVHGGCSTSGQSISIPASGKGKA